MTTYNKNGRPRKRRCDTKYIKDKTPEQFIKLRSEGKTIAQTARDIGVATSTLLTWGDDPDKPEMAEAWKVGETAYQAHYEDLVEQILKDPNKKWSTAQNTLLLQRLKAQFSTDWSEKRTSEVSITDKTKNMSDEELKNEITKKVRQAMGLKADLKAVDE